MSNSFGDRQKEFFMQDGRKPRKRILTASILVICILTALCLCACESSGSKVYSRVDDMIYLGQYPQSAVTDSSLTDALTALAGTLPAEGENGAWTSYGYYVDGSIEDYMWYIDVEYESEKYRGVYFTDYRPWWTDGSRWCSELYDTSISGYNGTQVNIRYDDCNPFGMIAGYFGKIYGLSKHTSKTASESTISDFNSFTKLFADFMGNFEVPKDGTAYIPAIDDEALSEYTLFYNKAIELYNSSLVSFTQNVSNSLTKSAVIGANHSYTMLFGNEVSSDIDYQMLIANLFGFSSKTDFMRYAQKLADTYAKYRTNIENSVTASGPLVNGCFYTEDGSFVFPIAVKNELSSPVLTYVIIDTDGLVSVWVNDIDSALWATNFNSSYHTDSIINNKLYCKNILFVTGPGSIDLDDTKQYGNGYSVNTVYWFKYEPVKWLILEESGGKAFLHADIGLDSQAYYIDCSPYTIDDETVYPNNYAHSSIRAWLNDTFYNTVFNDSEKEIILTTTVDNSVASTGLDVNEYACEDTSDKVFLLSYEEAMNCIKGETLVEGDMKRKRQSSDYAKCQGISVSKEFAWMGGCGWWLRTPSARCSTDVNAVGADGDCGSSKNKMNNTIDRTCEGIVPAIWITL